jgi:lysophospholipase L1-like esterase
MWLGDSISSNGQQNAVVTLDGGAWSLTFPTLTNINALGLFVRTVNSQWPSPAGNGSLTWTAANKSFKWKTFGDTYGPEVVISRSGIFRLESGTAGGALIISVINRVSYLPAVDATDTVVPGTTLYAFPSSGGASFTGWTELLLNCPFGTSLNYAISGMTAVEGLTMSPQWESVYSDITNIHIGTNDVTDIALAGLAIAAIRAMIAKRKLIGSKCIVWTLLPYNARSTDASKAVQYFNLKLRQVGIDDKVDIVDVWKYVANPDTSVAWSTTPAMLSGDGLHPSFLGSYIMAKRGGFNAFSKYVQQCLVSTPVAVAYDATLAPTGNLITNPTLTGTTGTKGGAYATGDVPTSWTVTRAVGSVATVVCVSTDGGTVPRTDTGQGHWFQMNISNAGGVDGEQIMLRGTSFLAGAMIPEVGSSYVFEGECQVKVTGGTGLSGFNVNFYFAQGNSYAVYMASTTTAGLGTIDGDTVYIPFKSRPFKIPAGLTNFNVSIFASLLAGAACTVNVGQTLNLHKVL